ncbi:Retron-type reverse transcriptase [bacterium]|nr:Retron-type reverse transcriptase [bacterium]
MSCEVWNSLRSSDWTNASDASGQPTGRHDGDALAFLQRHERECLQYGRMQVSEQRALQRDLPSRIADTRNLWCAVSFLARKGRKAPGPNGEWLHELYRDDPDRLRNSVRELSRAILSRTYRPGPALLIHVPKASGRGTRPIEVANWQDRVVQRAIVQIIQPLLDPQFEACNVGFRPGYDRLTTVAWVRALTECEERFVWVTADLSTAFTRVPHQRLFDRLDRTLKCKPVTRLIRRILRANNPSGIGIPQGGPLSPLLLNVLLDGALDKRWAARHPAVPLVRYADDLLLLCRDRNEAERGYATLRELVTPAGFTLKGTAERDIITSARFQPERGIEARSGNHGQVPPGAGAQGAFASGD